MSESESQNDHFKVIEKINQKYFSEIEHSVLHFQQSLFDLQNEFYKSWKNAITSNIELQKEFASHSSYNYLFPKPAQDILEKTSEEILKYRLACNKIAIAAIESTKNNAKTWNDNAKTFVDLNRKIVHYWATAFTPKS